MCGAKPQPAISFLPWRSVVLGSHTSLSQSDLLNAHVAPHKLRRKSILQQVRWCSYGGDMPVPEALLASHMPFVHIELRLTKNYRVPEQVLHSAFIAAKGSSA